MAGQIYTVLNSRAAQCCSASLEYLVYDRPMVQRNYAVSVNPFDDPQAKAVRLRAIKTNKNIGFIIAIFQIFAYIPKFARFPGHALDTDIMTVKQVAAQQMEGSVISFRNYHGLAMVNRSGQRLGAGDWRRP